MTTASDCFTAHNKKRKIVTCNICNAFFHTLFCAIATCCLPGKKVLAPTRPFFPLERMRCCVVL